MTQSDIIKLLRKSKKPLSAREINKILGITCAHSNLKKLREHNEVKFEYTPKENLYFV